MHDTINFNKTNHVDDPGVDLTPAEVAERFWASDEAKEWYLLVKANKPAGPLARLALSWIPEHVGGWDGGPEVWHRIDDAIFDARPWKKD